MLTLALTLVKYRNINAFNNVHIIDLKKSLHSTDLYGLLTPVTASQVRLRLRDEPVAADTTEGAKAADSHDVMAAFAMDGPERRPPLPHRLDVLKRA